MKRHFVNALIISCLSIASAYASPVTQSEALSSAKSFLKHIGHNVDLENLPATRAEEISDAHRPYFIFNAKDNAGYVIVAADDRARSVLGYSLSGNLDPDNLPAACEAWLKQYAAEISNLNTASCNSSTRADESTAPDYPKQAVEPILKSLWDQEAPYNLDCPKDAAGRPYATGCVATAVAQIMYHYRYPERGTGSVSYEDKNNNTVLSLNFADYPDFAWDKMTDTYGIGSSTESCQAVASLMKAVGYASQMQYGRTSIAYSTNAAKALVNNFGYDKNIHKYERALMSEKEWTAIILEDLYEGRPVLYDGFNSEGGHTFVCDGYDGNGFFHINWGWSGLSDGYYALSALNPTHQSTGGTSSGYNLQQVIITHIAPPGKFSSVAQRDGQFDISSLYFHSKDGFTIAGDDTTVTSTPDEAYIFIYAYNKGLWELSGEVCMAIMAEEGITPVYKRTLYFLQPNSRADLRFYPSYSTLTDGSPLPEGTYHMGFFYRPDGETKWSPMRSSSGAPNECKITIGSESITMSTVTPEEASVGTVEAEKPNIAVTPGLIHVTSPAGIAAAALYDMSGRLCSQEAASAQEVTISTAHLSSGIYILHLTTSDGRSSALKVRL